MRLLASVLVALGTMAAAREAGAFCGFYVSGADAQLVADASKVVLMREGTRTVLSMQNDYKGPPQGFAMVVPVPVVLQKENVKTLPHDLFARVEKLSAPRLVEYWERDPCAQESEGIGLGNIGTIGHGAGSGTGQGFGAGRSQVTIEAQFEVGEYEIVILSAKDAAALDAWLRENHYAIPEGAEPFFRPYVQAGSKFFVAKVNPAKVTFENGVATLSPLRFHYDSDRFELPVRLGLVNSAGKQDLVVHVLAPGKRYDVANYPNVTIPTNLDVAESARERFGEVYAALFDRTIERNPKAIVTEYAWPSSSCDPCPGGTSGLSTRDLLTLGADVLPRAHAGGGRLGPGARFGGLPQFVLTRLHARYGKDSLGADLVFKEAEPIVGGRETPNASGKLEEGATKSSSNSFQARYAIRHAWPGKVECASPKRGVWTGPWAWPDAGATKNETVPATKLAYAPRGRIDLTKMLATDLGAALAPSASAAPVADAGGASSAPAPAKCGCRAPGGAADLGFGALGGLAFAAAALARRLVCSRTR